MPHRRPVNEYERESGALYRCKRNTVVEKSFGLLRICKQIAFRLKKCRVPKHFAMTQRNAQRASRSTLNVSLLCNAALVRKELAH
jgi:hypothetical protein